MARIRQTKPEFWTHDDVLKVSRDARLLFIGMWNFMDANGVHPAKVNTLRCEIFPGDEDVTVAMVQKWVTELIAASLLVEYEKDGKRYWWAPGFRKHQIIKDEKPRHAGPNNKDLEQKLPQSSGSDAGELPDQSGATTARLHHGLGTRDLITDSPPTPSPGSEGGDGKKPKPIGPEFRPAIDAVEAAGVMFAEDAVRTAAGNGHTPATVIAICETYAAHAHEIGGPGLLHARLTKVSARPGPTENWPKPLTKPRVPVAPPEDVLRAQFWEQGRDKGVPDNEIEQLWQKRSRRIRGPD